MRKLWHRITGKPNFRAVYDGESHFNPQTRRGGRTVRMSYSTARSYAKIFNGEVIFDPAP